MLELLNSKKFFYSAVSILLAVLVGIGGYFVYDQYFAEPEQAKSEISARQSGGTTISIGNRTQNVEVPAKSEQNFKSTIRLIASGEILTHDTVNTQAKTANSYDYLKLMNGAKTFYDKSDIGFCVQAVPSGGDEFGISGYPEFNAHQSLVKNMVDLGCNIVAHGTRNFNDKGQGAINKTLQTWQSQKDVAISGASLSKEASNKPVFFDVEGVKFVFISYAGKSNKNLDNDFGVNIYSEAKASSVLKNARDQADFIIVSINWGNENSPDISPNQDKIASFLSKNGVDLVLGHGQHVQAPVKKIKNGDQETVVWYGIGNFLNSQLEPEALFNGLPVVDIDTQTKTVKELSFLPLYMHYEWTAQEKASGNLLARKNLGLHTFDQAGPLVPKSQLGTDVNAQQKRLNDILNKFTPVKILNPSEF